MRMARSGQLQKKVTESDLIALLDQLSQQENKTNKTKIVVSKSFYFVFIIIIIILDEEHYGLTKWLQSLKEKLLVWTRMMMMTFSIKFQFELIHMYCLN